MMGRKGRAEPLGRLDADLAEKQEPRQTRTNPGDRTKKELALRTPNREVFSLSSFFQDQLVEGQIENGFAKSTILTLQLLKSLGLVEV